MHNNVIQCGTELAMHQIGQDIQSEHLPLHKNEGVNIYIAAPCFSFPGYAGLNLPFHAWEAAVADGRSSGSAGGSSSSSASSGSSDRSDSSDINNHSITNTTAAWIKIHTTPCKLR